MKYHINWKSFMVGLAAAGIIVIGVAAQSPEPLAPVERVGRYQVTAANGQAFVVDSVTGEVWGHYDPHFKSNKLRMGRK